MHDLCFVQDITRLEIVLLWLDGWRLYFFSGIRVSNGRDRVPYETGDGKNSVGG